MVFFAMERLMQGVIGPASVFGGEAWLKKV
jgi:hypothetical protein